MSKQLSVTEFTDSGAEYIRRIFRASPPAGTTVDDILEPAYWVHIAAKLKPDGGDIIEVLPEDKAFYAELLVLSASKIHAKVVPIVAVKLASAVSKKSEPTPKGFEISFKGPQRKWSIIRKADKVVVQEKFQNKVDAEIWLEKNLPDLTK